MCESRPLALDDTTATVMNRHDPNSYWSGSQAREAQYLYVAFCELACAVFDYCEGARMQSPLSDESHLWEWRGGTRQSWAGTVLYYSLVHTARLLVFLACGDFPTAHALLGHCFDPVKDSVSTTWLRGFLRDGGDNNNQVSMRVSFAKLLEYWSSHATADCEDVRKNYTIKP
jgi:hypothetical protein